MQNTDFIIEMDPTAIHTLALLSTFDASSNATQQEYLMRLLDKAFGNDGEIMRWRKASPNADALIVKLLTLDHANGTNDHDTRPLKNDALEILNPILRSALRDNFFSLSKLVDSQSPLPRSREYWDLAKRASQLKNQSIGDERQWAAELIASLGPLQE